MKIYKHDEEGVLIISSENQSQFKDIEILDIKGSVKIIATLPKLTTIRSGGYTSIYSNAQVPKLTTIRSGGDTYINSKAPKLTTIRSGGDTSIYSKAPKLTTIRSGGDTSIYSNAPKLTTIRSGGYTYINSKAPKLTTIRSGGYTSIYSNAPKLTTIRSGGYTSIYSNAQVPKLTTIRSGGYTYINSNAPKLTTIRSGGDTSIYSKAPKLTTIRSKKGLYIYVKLDIETERRLWKNHRNNTWHLSDHSSEFLLSQKGSIEYSIANVGFGDDKKLFDKIRKDELTAQEVFAVENTEQRRIAYERMDKSKMKELKGFTVLDERIDNYGNPEKIVQFSIDSFNIPFIYFNCFCPSTKREYFIETDQLTCALAKARSFGFDKKIEFSEEW